MFLLANVPSTRVPVALYCVKSATVPILMFVKIKIDLNIFFSLVRIGYHKGYPVHCFLLAVLTFFQVWFCLLCWRFYFPISCCDDDENGVM